MIAQEFRIENMVLIGQDECLIIELFQDECKTRRGFVSYDKVDGISLTEDWLLRLGFGLRYKYLFDIRLNLEDQLLLHFNDDNYEVQVAEINSPIIAYIKFVHQLQNLYFALTGEELTLKK